MSLSSVNEQISAQVLSVSWVIKIEAITWNRASCCRHCLLVQKLPEGAFVITIWKHSQYCQGRKKKYWKISQLQSVRKLKYNHSYGLASPKRKQQQADCFSEPEQYIFMTVLVFSSKQIYCWQKALDWLPGRSNSLIYPYATQLAFIVQIFISSLCFNHDLHKHGSAVVGRYLSLRACSLLEHSLEKQHAVLFWRGLTRCSDANNFFHKTMRCKSQDHFHSGAWIPPAPAAGSR